MEDETPRSSLSDDQTVERLWRFEFELLRVDPDWQDGQYSHLDFDDAYELAEVIQEEPTKNVVMVNGYLVHNGDPIMLELPMAA